MSFCAVGEIAPHAKVAAQSPVNPPLVAPASTETMSPSFSTRLPGMPWMMTSLTEMQVLAGKPP